MDNENINVTGEYSFKDHLISNNPIADDMEYGDYVDILEAKIKDQGTKNIGIIAPYGAGKSSLIETYKLRSSVQNNESKILTISLANFNSDKTKESSNNGSGNSVGDIDCELEKSILQQILFKAKNKDLPDSQFERIDGNKKVNPFSTSLSIIASIFGIVLTVLEFFGKLPESTGKLFYVLLILTALSCFASAYILIKNKIVSKVKFKDFEVYLNSCNNDITLNLFLDEILYFFRKKEVEVVIIEDLDRFKNTNIFSKLRELNFLINNSDNIEQKVTFVYSVKDDLFKTDADRAKFFDYIISLMPVLSYTNAGNKLKNLLIDHCSDDMLLPDLYIQEISHFVVEMRILKNIVNDYIMYYHLLNLNKFGDENRNIKLFSLMLYKNINPNDYAKLQYGNGNLASIFNNLRTNVKKKLEALKKEITTKECDIEAAQNTTIKSFDQLKWIVKAVIFENRNYSYEGDPPEIESLTTFEGVNYIKYRISRSEICCISVEQLNKKLGFSVLQEEKNIKNRTDEAIAKINEEIKEIREQIRLFSNCTVKEYLKDDASMLKDCDLLTKMLLSNGYIAEDYRDYMSKNGQEIITSNDNDFIKNVIAKQKMEFSIKLDKPECVIQELQPHHFSDIYTFNYDIVMSLLIRTSCEKKENLINLLSSDGKETNEFIISYINDDNDINLILDNLIPSFDNLYNIMLASNVNNKFGMIEYLIDNFDIKLITKQNQNSCITKYLSELKLCINKFKSEKLQELLNVIITCDVCLKDIECIPERYHIAETIVDHSKFEINSGNLKFFLEKIKREESSKVDNALYSTILETKYEKLITYVENSFDKLLDIILSKDAHLENQDAFEKVLSYSTTQVYKDMFIEKSAIKYDLFNAISAECAKKSFEKLKIHPRWSNISIAINSNKVDIKELITYLEEFSMDLGLDELKDVTLFNLICKQKYNKAESLKNLLLSYKGTISFDTNIPEENLVILLEQNKIVLNDANFRAAARKPMVIEQIIYQNSIYAEKLNYIGFDRVVWTYLFESSKLSWAIKSKILNIWRSSYLPTSDQEVVVLSDVLLNWSISETIPSNLIEHCLKNTALAKEVKENIIIKCCRNLDKPTLILFVNYVDPLYGEMISKSKIQIDKTKINPQIMSLLKDKSILNYNYGSKNYNIK